MSSRYIGAPRAAAAIVVVPLAVAALCGCATSPVSAADTEPVPSERMLEPKYLQESPDTGTLSVKRDAGFLGKGCSVRLAIDEQPVADFRASERLVLHLPAGEHLLTVAIKHSGLCGLGNAGGVAEARTVVTGSTAVAYRIAIGSGGDLALYPTRIE